MREDGEVTYYFIQHEERPRGEGDTKTPRWAESSLEHFLFAAMSYQDKRGEKAADYRRLLEPQNASSHLWQKFGIHGYMELEDAEATLAALQQRCPDRKFRVVCRTVIQRTTMASAHWLRDA